MAPSPREFFANAQNYLHKDFGVALRQDIIRQEVGHVSGKRILDIGCGDGSISLQFVRANELTLLDFSPGMLEVARRRVPRHAHGSVRLLEQDFMTLAPLHQFDIIFFIGVIAHVPGSVPDTIEFLARLLADDGELYFQFTDANHLLAKLELVVRKDYIINRTPSHEVEALLARAGLTVRKRIRYATIIPGMGRLPNRLLLTYVRTVSRYGVLAPLRNEYIYVVSRRSPAHVAMP